MLLILGCASPLLVPTEHDAERARVQWPTATLSSLSEGQQLYVSKCGSCHYLYRPHQFAAEKWVEEMDEMAGRAKLTSSEKERVLVYLVTMAGSSDTAAKARLFNP